MKSKHEDQIMTGLDVFDTRYIRCTSLWVEFPSPVPFDDECTVADRPTLRQLARLDEDYTNALVVLVDSRTARLYEVVLGGPGGNRYR